MCALLQPGESGAPGLTASLLRSLDFSSLNGEL